MKVVLYARSSRDKHGVSTQGQLSKLRDRAEEAGWQILGEYADPGIHNDMMPDDRPGLGKLFTDLSSGSVRPEALVCTESSRISRTPWTTALIEHLLERHGVRTQPMNLPQGEDADALLFKDLMGVLDQHASRSAADRAKASVKQIFRDGYVHAGKAPIGYLHEDVDLGIKREGKPAIKKRLVPDPDVAPMVAEYLGFRAEGRARKECKARSGLDLKDTTLISIERNALLYAGVATLAKSKTIRVEGRKKQIPLPRKDWELKPDNHPALITRSKAEAVLMNVSERSARQPQPKALLAGVLVTPDGKYFHSEIRGNHRYYRAEKGKTFRCDLIDRTVICKMVEELTGTDIMANATAEAIQRIGADDAAAVQKKIREFDAKIGRLVSVIEAGGDVQELADRISELKSERDRLQAALTSEEETARMRSEIAKWTPKYIEARLEFLQSSDLLDDGPDRVRARERERDEVKALVDRIILDPKTEELRIIYRFHANLAPEGRSLPVGMVSRRGVEPLFPP